MAVFLRDRQTKPPRLLSICPTQDNEYSVTALGCFFEYVLKRACVQQPTFSRKAEAQAIRALKPCVRARLMRLG